MKNRPFKQIDVFTSTPYLGNPVAVVLDGEGLSDAEMAGFARWTNLSETTFVLPPTHSTADYRLRIFTPGGELPFAGHPTLGSCHAWLESGGQAKNSECIVQECAKGLIRIRRDSNSPRLAFAAPSLLRSTPSPELLAQVASALGIQTTQITAAQHLDNGPVWLGLLLDSPETVLQITPNHQALAQLKIKVGVAGIYPVDTATPRLIARANREALAFAQSSSTAAAGFAASLEVRAFAAGIGINEDPATGSLNASLAQWLIADGYLPAHYTASQGVCIGRAGQIQIQRDGQGQVWVGGQSVTCLDGVVML